MEKVKVFQYIEIDPNLKTKYRELENYNCFQLLGRNFLSAIFFSLVDYILSNKITKYLDWFLNFRSNNQMVLKIQKALQSQKISTSIKTFLEELILIDRENVVGGILLEEMLKQKFGYYNDYKSQFSQTLQKIYQQIPLGICFLGQVQSSQGISKIKIWQSDKEYYLAKYNPDFIILKKCIFCQQKHEKGFTNKGCFHNICLNCIQLRLQNSNQSLIACSQFACPKISRIDIEKCLQNNNLNKITGSQNQFENTYNSQSKNNLQLSASQNFDENKNQVKMEQNQNQNCCFKCQKEQKNELFINSTCNHQLCVNCIKQNSTQWCPISKCQGRIDISKAQIYLDKQKQLANRDCAGCYKIIKDGQNFFTNTCLHNICNNCLKTPIFKISNKSNYCPSSNCKFCLDKNMLEQYLKIEKVQFECCKCKELWIWDNMYCNPSCAHVVCFSCAQKMIQKEFYNCPRGNCSKNFFCKEFENFYEEQQMKLINEQEKLIKQQEQEVKNQKELMQQEELKKAEEEKQLQKGIENSFTTQPIQNKSRFVSSKQQNLQTSQQIIIKEIDVDQFKEQKSQIINKQEDQINSQKNLRYQQQEQERVKELEIGECTLCFSPFSQYNLKQQINCQIHQIGVCCIIKTQQCPQCESKRSTSQIYRPKPKLIIECYKQQDLENASYLKNQISPYNNYVDDSRVNTRLTQTQSQIKSTQRNSTMDNNLFRSQIGGSNTQKQYAAGYQYRR